MRNANIPPKYARRARRIVAGCLALIAAGAAGCNCYQPRPGRCGIGDPCCPVAMEDPFPHDQCVPPKHVDPDHFGYVRPSWRVLGEQVSPCCTVPYAEGEYQDPAMPAPVLEVAPEPEMTPLSKSRAPSARPAVQEAPSVITEGIVRPASFTLHPSAAGR